MLAKMASAWMFLALVLVLDKRRQCMSGWWSSGLLRHAVFFLAMYQRFGGTHCQKTTRHNIPEDSHLHTRCRENLTSHRI
jgi:hypothetical protein